MPQTYFIDGYNVVHHCSQLKRLARHDFEAARDKLIDRVARFCADAGKRAKIVFDGRGHLPDILPPHHGAPGLDVIYSADGQTADSYIEREIYDAPDRRDLVVVSADRGLRDLCRGLGAFTMLPDNFLATVQESLLQSRAELRALKPTQGSPRLEDHLDESALERLKRLKEELEK